MGYHMTPKTQKSIHDMKHVISPSKMIQNSTFSKEDHENCFQDVWIPSNEVECL